MQNIVSKTAIEEIVNDYLAQRPEEFLVEVIALPSFDFEVVLDSDKSLSIATCSELTKLIEGSFDREVQDFSLMVASAGIGSPLKLPRQFDKVLGKDVEIIMKNGVKLLVHLNAHDQDGIEVSYWVKELVEGKKRKVEIEKHERVQFADIKSVCEALIV